MAETVLLVGNSGTGKSHVLTGLGMAAIRAGHRVRFITAATLVDAGQRTDAGAGRVAGAQPQRALTRMLGGFYQYFALYHTLPKLGAVRDEVRRLWRAALRRRSQRGRLTWEEWRRKPWFDLPEPKLIHRTV